MLLANVLKTLWILLDRRRRWVFVGIVALLFVAGIFEMLGMMMIYGFIRGLSVDDDGSRGGHLARGVELLLGRLEPLHFVLASGSILVAFMIAKNGLSILVSTLLSRFLMRLNERVSRSLFTGYLLARYEVFKHRGVGKPAANISRIFELFNTCFGAAARILSDGATITMVVLLLLFVDPWLTLVGVALFGGVGTGLYWSTQRLQAAIGRAENRARDEGRRYLTEGFGGLIDGRLSNTQSFFVSGYVRALRRIFVTGTRKNLLSLLPRTINEILLVTTIVSAVVFTTLRDETLTGVLPKLAIFGFAGLKMTGAMSRINRAFQKLRQKHGQFKYLHQAVRDVAPELFGKPATKDNYLAQAVPGAEVLDFRSAIVLNDVEFAYPKSTRPAIKPTSLTIPRGAFVAFCGPSGGGKSTLTLLLMGLLTPKAGTIEVDGKNVFEYLPGWHANIGYVGQQMFIANRSVRENVAFGLARDEIDDDRVWRSLELASAAEFVRNLDAGLDTNLSEGGSLLSGGQRQRIIIARALYRDPEVIVFDEGTAALDNQTERQITSALQRLSRDKTIICVAHRLTTIRTCDCIYVIEDGQIAAQGTYTELLQTSESFARIAREDPEEPEASEEPSIDQDDDALLAAPGHKVGVSR